HRTAWPEVTVGDDSLSQCIYELREILGDKDHRLIRTVSRRGYVLDGRPKEHQAGRSPAPLAAMPDSSAPKAEALFARLGGAAKLVAMLSVLVCVVLSGLFLLTPTAQKSRTYDVPLDFKPAPLPPSAINKLFTDDDAKRVAEIARGKQLPLPR